MPQAIAPKYGRSTLRDVLIPRIGKEFRIVFGGRSSSTDGKNIFVADLPDSADIDVRIQAEVSAYHEAEHVRVIQGVGAKGVFKGAKVWSDISSKFTEGMNRREKKTMCDLVNVFEDIRIDREVCERYPGCVEKYRRSDENTLQKMIPNIGKMPLWFRATCLAIFKAHNRYFQSRCYSPVGEDKLFGDDAVKAYDVLFAQHEKAIDKAASLEAVVGLAKKVLPEVLKNFTPPPPPPPPPPQQQQQEQQESESQEASEESESNEAESQESDSSDPKESKSKESKEDDSEESDSSAKEPEEEAESQEGESGESKSEGEEPKEEDSEGEGSEEGEPTEEGSEEDEPESKGGDSGEDESTPQEPEQQGGGSDVSEEPEQQEPEEPDTDGEGGASGEDETNEPGEDESEDSGEDSGEESEEEGSEDGGGKGESSSPAFPGQFREEELDEAAMDISNTRMESINTVASDYYSVHPSVKDQHINAPIHNSGVDWLNQGRPYFGGIEAKIRHILLDEKAPKVIDSLPRGKHLDTRHLYRKDDYKLGKQPAIWETRLSGINIDTALHISVDGSGSMGEKGRWNMQMAIMTALCNLLDTCSVKYTTVEWSLGSNSSAYRENAHQRVLPVQYRRFSQWGERLNPHRIPEYPLGGFTPTADIIPIGLEELSARNEVRKALVMFTDGAPYYADGSYTGPVTTAAVAFAEEQMDKARAAGFKTFGFGIDIDRGSMEDRIMTRLFKGGWVRLDFSMNPSHIATIIVEKLKEAFQ